MTHTIVLIGAGSANFGLATLGDIFRSPILSGSKIVLCDLDAEAVSRVQKIGAQYIAEHHLPFELVATTSRQEALPGADFVVISIEVGDRFLLWEQDWRIAQQYGIRQVYGENGGPGGLFHALRIVPPILDICADVERLCPQATVFNFSNPMSRICLTVKRRFPHLRFIGLCHEIASLPEHLPAMLGVPFEGLSVTAGGLNHFSVLLAARYKATGKDAYPDVRAKAPAYFAHQPSWADKARPTLGTGPFGSLVEGREWVERQLFLFILQRYGYLPVTTDSHFGEYIRWAHEVVDHAGILDFWLTYRRVCKERAPEARISGSHERVVPIMEGILTDSHQEEMAVNIMNDGLIDNLPRDLVVEAPCTVDKDGVHGTPLGMLPRGIASLLLQQAPVLDLTAEAILTGSREVTLQALLADPTVDSARAAEQVLDTMLRLQEKYLGYIK